MCLWPTYDLRETAKNFVKKADKSFPTTSSRKYQTRVILFLSSTALTS